MELEGLHSSPAPEAEQNDGQSRQFAIVLKLSRNDRLWFFLAYD